MQSRSEYIEKYSISHRNPVNQIIHMICVPTIFVATVAFGWLIPLGLFLPGIPADAARWINLGTVAALPVLYFYARLGWSSLLTGSVWLTASYAICASIQAAGGSLFWISFIAWVTAWVVQLYGHKVEGAKPSFIDDLVFLLIGPLFVRDKLIRLLRTGSI